MKYMESSEAKAPEDKDRLPRKVCAFAAFFVFAVPAFALAVGRAAHGTLVELAARAEQGGVRDAFANALLDAHAFFAWGFFALALLLSVWTFALARRNAAAGTLLGGGRIVTAFAASASVSVFYLGVLLVVVCRLLTPFLLR
ncbi:MAG: hypothetical protein ACI4QA_01325 [Candidatus Spyradosoma sp.]